MMWLDINATVCCLTLVRTVKPCWPRVALNPVRMEACVRSPKTLRASLVCVLKDGKAKRVRWISMNVSKTLVETMPSVKTLLAPTNAVVNRATQAATVRQTLMTASPTLAVTVASVKTLWTPSLAPAYQVSGGVDVRRTLMNVTVTHVKTAPTARIV